MAASILCFLLGAMVGKKSKSLNPFVMIFLGVKVLIFLLH